jgi:hypothetical protein
MRTNSISQNHVELILDNNMVIVFSYGKAIAARIETNNKNEFIGNSDFYDYSVTTSKHVNSSFPELKTRKPDTMVSDAEFTLENLYKMAGVK